MEQFDSAVEKSSKVLEQQQRNDEQQCPSCAYRFSSSILFLHDGHLPFWLPGFYVVITCFVCLLK